MYFDTSRFINANYCIVIVDAFDFIYETSMLTIHRRQIVNLSIAYSIQGSLSYSIHFVDLNYIYPILFSDNWTKKATSDTIRC